MRVVNSIERQVLHSEWENWLVNEKLLCDDLEQMLQGGKQSNGGPGHLGRRSEDAQSVMTALSKDRRKALESWRDEHCGSCRTDLQAVMEGHKSSW